MKIPENFKQKYHLTGTSYDPANVDAALSELFAISSKLYKENADLKAELARLQDSSDVSVGVKSAADFSGIEAMIMCLEQRLDDIKSTVNDALCIANDAAISAKRAEESALEAKKSADGVTALTTDALKITRDVRNTVISIDTKLDFMPLAEGGEVDERSVEELIAIANEAAEEALEEFELPAEDESAQEDEPEVPEEITEEPAQEKAVEDTEVSETKEESGDIAADLIRTVGLDGEVEQIEPAEEVSDDDLPSKLAEMYSAEKTTEPEAKPEEAPAEDEKSSPTSFNDMKSALDAIRARLKK